MKRFKPIAFGMVALLGMPSYALAADSSDTQQLRQEIQQLKQEYDQRIKALEQKLEKAETTAQQARATAEQAANAPPPVTPTKSNAFNPDISLILQGTYANLSQDPAGNRITGFLTAPEVGPQKRGFSLAETEFDAFATIDPYFYGGANLSLDPDGGISVEEAYAQTIGLSNGFTIKGGRFFSGIGYLNEIHQHAWDFFDAPLVYQAFLGTGPGGNFGNDGLQLRWLAPTDLFLELGAEIGRGSNFPGSDSNRNGIGSETVFAHVGGDIGVSQSYRAGVSYLHTSARDREFSDTDLTGTGVNNSFSGRGNLYILDGVWKYAPNGDASIINFKLQGEYFWRREDGSVTYDKDGNSLGPTTADHSSAQSGGYLQGVWQFMPRWRVGMRGDLLKRGSLDFGANNANLARPDFDPKKISLMVDFSPSEFSRLRLQFAHDKSAEGQTDDEFVLQYIYSLGTHGAHQF